VAPGTVDLVDRTLSGGRITATDLELEPLLRAFDVAPTPYVDFLGDAAVAWEGSLKPLELDGTFDTTVRSLRVGDRPIRSSTVSVLLDIPEGSAHGRISLRHDRVVLTAESVKTPRNRGSAIVDIGLGPRGPLDLRADLFQADLADFAPLGDVGLKGQGRITGRIAGPFNRLSFEGHGDVNGFEVLGIPYADHLVARILSPDMKSLFLEDAVATIGTVRYHGRYDMSFRSPMSLRTDITVQGGRIEDLVHMFVDLDGIRGEISGGRLSLAGPLLDMTGEAHLRFHDVDLYGETFPVGEAHGFMDTGVFTLDDLRVRRANGAAGLTLRGTVERAWKLDMELLADGLTIEGLDRLAPYDHGITGRISGHARLTNTLFDPSPAGRIVVSGVKYRGELADDSVIEFHTVEGVAQVVGTLLGGTARAEGTVGLWGEQPYAFDVKLTDVPAHVLYPDGADGSPISALVSGEMDLSGHFGETWSPVTLRAELVNVSVGWSGHTLTNQRRWHYEQDGNNWRLANVGLAGGATDVILERATGGDVLDLAGRGRLDLDLLRAVVPGLERADGYAELTFSAQGTRPDVKAVVTADVFADLFRHSSTPVTFESSEAHLTITEDRFDITSATGDVGGGTWEAGGRIDAESFVPRRWGLWMNIRDAQVQWVETLPPAIGDAALEFDGPSDALLLSGDVTIDDMTFEDRIAWEDWVVAFEEEMLVEPSTGEDAAPLFSLDVEIDADRTIRLRNNIAEGVASAQLRIIGDTARPGLTGTVTIEDGLAFVQDREFRIDRGVLRFDDPWTWDPQLDISLVTDIDNRDQRYRVTYQVSGPFSDWNAKAISDPPLASADVNALLWFGMTTDDLEAQGQMEEAVVQSVVDLIVADFFLSGQVSLAESFSRGVPDLLTPDRVDFVTGVNTRGEYSPDPRLLVEKDLDDEGDLEVRWEQDLTRVEDYYLTISRRVGRVWSLSGWYAGLQRDRVLPIGGAYGVDVSARVELE
jgi:autotransporter translocation and assembly factor TamB